MNIGLEVDKKSLADVLSKMEFAGFAASRYFREAMEEANMLVEANVEIRTPKGYSGHLAASISSQLISDVMGVVTGITSSTLNYAAAVEKGSRPHFPPIEALTGKKESLDLWAQQKGLNPFAVAKGIAKRGTKARNMFKDGLAASKLNVYAIFVKKAQAYIASLKG